MSDSAARCARCGHSKRYHYPTADNETHDNPNCCGDCYEERDWNRAGCPAFVPTPKSEREEVRGT
jgi:hypothetical protein